MVFGLLVPALVAHRHDRHLHLSRSGDQRTGTESRSCPKDWPWPHSLTGASGPSSLNWAKNSIGMNH